MKKLFVVLIVCGMIMPYAVSAQELKIGYVDILKVFNDYSKTQQYDETLEKQKEAKEQELEKDKESIKKMQEKLDLLQEKEQDKEKEKIIKAAGEFREKERRYIIDLKKERDEKMKEIIDDINKVVDEYAQKENYDMILNKGAVLYGDKGMDLTATILKIVNKRYKK